MKRKICIITGSRADYGIYFPILKRVQSSSKFQLQIVATGMHLMKDFGYTIKEIENDGFVISSKVDIGYKEDTGSAMATSVGQAVIKMANSFKSLKPDIILILGDRGEMLSAAIAANYLNIPVAHIHGGELSGHIDGIFRHAITKLSHLHLPPTVKSYERILKLGEEPWRVHRVGAPALDRIFNGYVSTAEELLIKYSFDVHKPFLLVVQHPVLEEEDEAQEQIKNTLEAIKDYMLPTVLIYPNADAGGRRMIKMIKKYCQKYSFIKSFKNLPHQDYLGLMAKASVLIGNSSSGIIEAPSFKIPVINIGTRQNCRERAGNIIDVSYEKKHIAMALKKAFNNKIFHTMIQKTINPYGDGHASERIVNILDSIKLDDKLVHKQMTY